MTSNELKKKIKAKFGTVRRFADTVGIDIKTIQYNLALSEVNEQSLRHIENLVDGVEAENTDISQEMRDKLREALEDYGGVRKFCEDYPEFNRTSIYQIVSGNRKTMNNTVRMLIDKLNIQL